MTLAEAHQAAREAVQHGRGPAPQPEGPPAPLSGSCARCGAPVSPRHGARFCSTTCQRSEVRDRRSSARAQLLEALAGLRLAVERVEGALKVMGFNPTHPRRPRSAR